MVTFVPLGGMRPDLNAAACEWRAIASAKHAASHQKTTASDTLNQRRSRPVVVGTAAHRRCRRDTRGVRGLKQAGEACGDKGAACSQDSASRVGEVAHVEYIRRMITL